MEPFHTTAKWNCVYSTFKNLSCRTSAFIYHSVISAKWNKAGCQSRSFLLNRPKKSVDAQRSWNLYQLSTKTTESSDKAIMMHMRQGRGIQKIKINLSLIGSAQTTIIFFKFYIIAREFPRMNLFSGSDRDLNLELDHDSNCNPDLS